MFHYRNQRIVLIIVILVIVGILAIYSASEVWADMKYGDSLYYVKRQSLFAIVGFIGMFLVSYMDIRRVVQYRKVLFFLCVVAMVLVLIPGIGIARNGSRSWFGIGSFLVQPSEFMKLSLIVYVAGELGSGKRYRRLLDYWKIIIASGVSFLLIMLQPDFGSGVVMCSAIVVMVIASGIDMKYFVYLLVVAGIGMVFLIVSAPYRLARITSFLDPFSDPLGSGFQTIQALFAIAPGGLFGLGFGESMQKHFYLPEPQTDFIFAILAEEMGFIGCMILILLFMVLLSEGMKIVRRCENSVLGYIAIGIIALFMIQVIINLGVVVNLFPITGVTLPFISYGGSSLVLMMGSMGILMAVSLRDH
ncbi:MAG: putative lipid II flippase FtsW [Erysipelotrichaceae bacterium]|nr:putative lipid II flippase FtsW [Erysipelotrichaceae bacterium]